MSMSRRTGSAMGLSTTAVAMMVAMSSPAAALAAGHHQVVFTQQCAYARYELHQRGNRGRFFDDYHHPGYSRGIVYPGYQRRAITAASRPPCGLPPTFLP